MVNIVTTPIRPREGLKLVKLAKLASTSRCGVSITPTEAKVGRILTMRTKHTPVVEQDIRSGSSSKQSTLEATTPSHE